MKLDPIERMAFRAPLIPSLLPTQMAGALAGALQQRTVDGERKNGAHPYEPEEVAQAAVHTRQDIILLIGWQRAVHSQLVNISRGVWVIAILAVLFFLRH